MKRDEPGRLADEGVLHLKVVANPQSSGGVLIKVRGNDREDVRKHQAEWSEWAKSLPKKDPGPSASEAENPGAYACQSVRGRCLRDRARR